jgi:hypothetical protein
VTNLYGDHATITLTDDRGRTVCKFVKEKPDSNWCVSDGPGRRKHKHIERLTELARQGKEFPPMRRGHLTPAHLTRLPDGRCYLEVPDLYLRWEKVTPVLDRLAEHNHWRITIAALRNHIGYK